MSIDRLDFENLTDSDLTELQTAQVPEGLRIEYKRDLYGNSDSEKRELLKDVSGFANAFGGHLIIGIEEKNGLPLSIPGIVNINPDDVVLRIDQLVRSGLESRIQGLLIRAVALQSGTHVFVLRIPRSWYPPHRVSAQGSNRFWIRNSGGTHEASVDELRTLFTLGTDAFHRVHQFRDERLGEILSGNNARPLKGDGRLILHIIPLAAVTSTFQVDLLKVFQLQQAFRPIGALGMSPRFNFEGFINERGGEHNFGYTQIFRNGVVEATKASIISKHQNKDFIAGLVLESQIFEVLPRYINGLRDVGTPPPLAVLFTFQGVRGIRYEVKMNILDDSAPPIERDILCLPNCLINEYGPNADYHLAVKPAFDALWNTTGRVDAQSFSSDGVWVGRAQK